MSNPSPSITDFRYGLEAGRCITRAGYGFVTIQRAGRLDAPYVHPSDADEFARLAAHAPEMLYVLRQVGRWKPTAFTINQVRALVNRIEQDGVK